MTDLNKVVERAVDGDADAYAELYQLSRQQIYLTCLGIVKNADNAEDIMQETFFTVMEKLHELKDKNSFNSWINRIAVNKCKKFLGKSTDISYEENFRESDREPADEELVLPDEYIENEEKRTIIMNIIMNSLSDVQRQTIILYYYNQLTVAEIAEQMECPLGTVTYRLSSAKKIIEKEILKYEEINNEKLHVALPVPFLTRLLKAESVKPPPVSYNIPDTHFNPLNIIPVLQEKLAVSTLTTSEAIISGSKTIAAITSVVIGGCGIGYSLTENQIHQKTTEEVINEIIYDNSSDNSNYSDDNFISQHIVESDIETESISTSATESPSEEMTDYVVTMQTPLSEPSITSTAITSLSTITTNITAPVSVNTSQAVTTKAQSAETALLITSSEATYEAVCNISAGNPVTVSEDGYVNLPVYVDLNGGGFEGMAFAISYDSDSLTLVDILKSKEAGYDKSGLESADIKSNVNRSTVIFLPLNSYATVTNYPQYPVCVLKFQMNENAAEGEYTVNFVNSLYPSDMTAQIEVVESLATETTDKRFYTVITEVGSILYNN